jgi:hypothetical protein
MDIDKFFQSKLFKRIILTIGILAVLLFVFWAGMFVDSKKADFSFKWGENYHRNFAGPKQGFFNDFMGNDFVNAHGVFGQIIKIDLSELVIEDKDNTEKIVLVKDDTIIRRFRDDVKISDLKVNDYIVVIGDPNDSGQIEAKLIRVMPPPPETSFEMSHPQWH